jgi:hypothetical protein
MENDRCLGLEGEKMQKIKMHRWATVGKGLKSICYLFLFFLFSLANFHHMSTHSNTSTIIKDTNISTSMSIIDDNTSIMMTTI